MRAAGRFLAERAVKEVGEGREASIKRLENFIAEFLKNYPEISYIARNGELDNPSITSTKISEENNTTINERLSKNTILYGPPGTGKTFLGLYLALDSVVEEKEYDKVIIVRSSVPSRRQGFLPGSEEEKNEIFEIPYIALVNELYNRSDAYKLLKNRDL